MRKENVFMVSGRQVDSAGVPQGAVLTHLLCADDEDAMRDFAVEALPRFVITSFVNLEVLDQTSKKIKAVLSGQDNSLSVFVQPDIGKRVTR